MGSPITLSGFNSIDFSVVLNAIMTQERVPVTLLERQQTSLTAQKSAFSTLASKLSSLQSAADGLTGQTAFVSTSATVSDPTRLTFSSGNTVAQGTYQITVNRLAQAQVSLSNGLVDKDTTVVASSGSISFGDGRTVTIDGPVTLDGPRLGHQRRGRRGVGLGRQERDRLSPDADGPGRQAPPTASRPRRARWPAATSRCRSPRPRARRTRRSRSTA